jgi:hypothetical protein
MSAPTGPLRELLEHVLEGEPSIGDEVDAVFRRADRLRRRRTQGLLAAGLGGAAMVVAVGYVLTTMLIPATPELRPAPAPLPASTPATVKPGPSVAADPVLDVIAPLVLSRSLRIVPNSAERGDGWRRYAVADGDQPRGTVQVAVYDKPGEYCFPVRADREACARAERADGLEFVRYDDESDQDRQVHQTIARRLSDGRTIAVMAAGERDAGAAKGRPALSGAQVEKVATDERVFGAFAGGSACGKGCPSFRTSVG